MKVFNAPQCLAAAPPRARTHTGRHAATWPFVFALSEARPGGTHVIRACVTSYRTTKKDIEWVVSQMNRLVEQIEEKV